MSEAMYYFDIGKVRAIYKGITPPELPTNTKRFSFDTEVDLEGMNGDVLLNLYNFAMLKNEPKLPPEPAAALWAKLGELPVGTHEELAKLDDTLALGVLSSLLGGDTEETKGKKAKKAKKKSVKKSSKTDLQEETASATSSVPAGTTATAETKEGQMATAKKAAKKKSAKRKVAAKKAATPKNTNGTPREGTTKAKLLNLLRKPGGATMAQMLALTGWKACAGTAKAVAVNAGLKYVKHSDPDGKKATRWEAQGKLKGE